jgi:hypothetical protein
MADEKKPTVKTKKIVDVARPGTTPPAENSKSVIITHHPTMRPPTDEADKSDESNQSAPVVSHSGHNVLQPLPTSPQPEKPEEPQPAPEAAAEAAPEVEFETDTEADDEPPKPEPATLDDKPNLSDMAAKPPASASAGTDAQIGIKQDQSEADLAAADDAEAKRQAELQVMIETKKFYLPINTAETQRTKEFIAAGILLSIVLGAFWIDIALDAGLVHLGGLKAITHFFN